MKTLKTYILVLGFTLVCTGPALASAGMNWQLFPKTELFHPLLADPKSATVKLTAAYQDATFKEFVAGQVNFGTNIGIFRASSRQTGIQYQLGISGAIYGIFALEPGHHGGFINVDFAGSLPFTLRKGDFSFRAQIYHQSSHMGDDYIVRNAGVRVTHGYESLDLLAAFENGPIRIYGGGEYWVRRNPRKRVDPFMIHWGFEYIPEWIIAESSGVGVWRFFFAHDQKHWQQNHFSTSFNIATGVQLSKNQNRGDTGRTLRIMLEIYQGIYPFGQFFFQDNDLLSAGLSIQTDL